MEDSFDDVPLKIWPRKNGAPQGYRIRAFIRPEGWFRICWDFLGATLTIALVYFVPFHISFFSDVRTCDSFHFRPKPFVPEPETYMPPLLPPAGYAFLFATYIFFLVDIVLNFFTGRLCRTSEEDTYVDDRLSEVAVRYLSGWFWLDAASCVPVTCILAELFPEVDLYNIGYLITFLRTLKLVQRTHGKPTRFLDYLLEWRQLFSYAFRQVFMCAGVVVTGLHMGACALWLSLRASTMPDSSWPVQLGLLDAPVLQQYAWSLFCTTSAMIGVGWSPFPPLTWQEATAWTVIMAVMACLFSVFNGFILVAVLSSVSHYNAYKERIDNVMDMLEYRHTPKALKRRVLKYLKYKYRKKRVWDEALFADELPYTLRAEVAMHACGSLLRQFWLLASQPQLLERTAMLLRHAVAAEGEFVATEGNPCYRMYFIANGVVEVSVGGKVQEQLRAGAYFNEHAILLPPSPDSLVEAARRLHVEEHWLLHSQWQRFPTCASVRALTNCELYKLEGAEMHELAAEYPEVELQLQQRGHQLAEILLQHWPSNPRQTSTIIVTQQARQSVGNRLTRHGRSLSRVQSPQSRQGRTNSPQWIPEVSRTPRAISFRLHSPQTTSGGHPTSSIFAGWREADEAHTRANGKGVSSWLDLTAPLLGGGDHRQTSGRAQGQARAVHADSPGGDPAGPGQAGGQDERPAPLQLAEEGRPSGDEGACSDCEAHRGVPPALERALEGALGGPQGSGEGLMSNDSVTEFLLHPLTLDLGVLALHEPVGT